MAADATRARAEAHASTRVPATKRALPLAAARRLLPFLLAPFVLVLISAADRVRDAWQAPLLAVGGVAWCMLALSCQLDEGPRGVLQRWARVLWARRLACGTALAITLALAYLARDGLASLLPAGGVASLAFLGGLALFAAAAVFAIVERALERSPIGDAKDATAAGLAAAVLPVAGVVLLVRASSSPPHLGLVGAVGAATSFVSLVLVLGVDRVIGRFEGEGSRVRPARRLVASRRDALTLARTLAAIAAGALLLLAALRVPIERRLVEDSAVAAIGGSVAPPARDDATLVRFYSPVLRLAPRERWPARPVEAFIAGAHNEPCPAAPSMPGGCTMLTHGAWAPATDEHVLKTLVYVQAAAYSRVAGVSPDEAKWMPQPVAQRTHRIVQYWIFYPYDRWSSRTALGQLVQEHEGDWEVVLVGLDERAAPLWVGYSAHCGGTWRPWSATLRASLVGDSALGVGEAAGVGPRSHPLVSVALGSHANYPSAGNRSPDWASCAPGRLGALGFGMTSFAANVREETPDAGPFEILRPVAPAVARATLRLPAFWGRGERIVAGGVLVSATDHGPPSPAYQGAIWDDPLRQVFGGAHWHCDAGPRCGA